MSKNYRCDERVIKSIVHHNVQVVNPENKLQFVVYYQNIKSGGLVMRNNLSRQKVRDVARCNVVYEFHCPANECIHSTPHGQRYIGHTVCTLSRRLSMHLQGGSIMDHFQQAHGRKITRAEIVDNTSIRYIEHDVCRLRVLESLLICIEKPELNEQLTGLRKTLKLFG